MEKITPKYIMSLAEEVAKNSKDPHTKVGAVVVDSLGGVLSMGYNRMPYRIPDEAKYWKRPVKYDYVRHAEEIALLNTTPTTAHRIYVTLSPCANCAKIIADTSIKEVIYKEYREDLKSEEILQNAGITMRSIDELS